MTTTAFDGFTEAQAALQRRIRDVHERVAAAASRAGRLPESVSVIAVSKTVPAETIKSVYALGLHTFGENRVQEAQRKAAEITLPDLRWELIGHLQSNKAGLAATLFDRVQSVDSVRIAEVLSAHAVKRAHALPILLEVNVSGESSKNGFKADELIAAARAITKLPHLRLDGLMTVAPNAEQPEDVRPVFRLLRELRDELRCEVPLNSDHGGWSCLSMGMTNDFEVAIEEGSTIVRIGRAIFGERPKATANAGG